MVFMCQISHSWGREAEVLGINTPLPPGTVPSQCQARVACESLPVGQPQCPQQRCLVVKFGSWYSGPCAGPSHFPSHQVTHGLTSQLNALHQFVAPGLLEAHPECPQGTRRGGQTGAPAPPGSALQGGQGAMGRPADWPGQSRPLRLGSFAGRGRFCNAGHFGRDSEIFIKGCLWTRG